jgi:hypothetical protein
MCDDRVEVDGVLHFVTDDGAFAETRTTVLAATTESVGIDETLDLDALAGSFHLPSFVTADDYDAPSAWISVDYLGGRGTGVVEGQASGEDECADADECSAWAESVPVGSWPSAEQGGGRPDRAGRAAGAETSRPGGPSAAPCAARAPAPPTYAVRSARSHPPVST